MICFGSVAILSLNWFSAEAQTSLAPATEVNLPRMVPDRAEIPRGIADQMLIALFNDLASAASLLWDPKYVTAIMIGPLQRIVLARDGFSQRLRVLCDKQHVSVTCLRSCPGLS